MLKSYWVLLSVIITLGVLLLGDGNLFVDCIGINWGTQAIHKLPPKTVVKMLQANGIKKVKLFDADQTILDALAGSDLEVMVAIPNGDMAAMTDYSRAQDWVQRNVTLLNFHGGVNIKYVAVGNEPFLTSYNGTFVNVTFPALRNIQKALDEAGIGDSVKATVPLNADVYGSPSTNSVPSAGRFRSDIADLMTAIVQFLSQNNAPFMVNIYPFLSLYGNDNFPIDYAFFDGVSNPVIDNGISYTNVFDANFDTLYSSLKAIGFGSLNIIVGEVGWPTDGDKNANIGYAMRFYKGLLPRLANNVGTPLRPGYIETYLFSLVDEDAKTVAPGNFERHWGIFRSDGQPKFPMDLSGKNQDEYLIGAADVDYQPNQWCMLNPNASNATWVAENINYACTFADCTPLGYGCSCAGLDANANASYAFNVYYQTQNQAPQACDFQGLAVVTTKNISQGNCNFTIQIATTASAMHIAMHTSHSFSLLLTFFCFLWLRISASWIR